jgi:uncharacterized protein (TIGR02118 family)
MAAMIRLVFLMRRQPHLSLEEFHTYWRDEHGPLVAFHQRHLGIVRYTQAHRLEDPANERMAEARGGMEPPYDGVAELWFHSEQAFAEAGRTPGGRAAGRALLEDEATFIDLASSPIWLAHNLPQVNPTPESVLARPMSPVVKLHFPLRHVPSLSLEEAQAYWRVQHGPLIRSMAPAMGMLRYQQVHRYPSSIEAGLRSARGTITEPYTGHAEAWTDRSRGRSPEAAAAGRAAIEDERHFIDFGRSTMWIGKEHVLVDRG